MNSFIPDFHVNRCLRYRYRYSECRRGADVCPHDAISLSDEGITLDASRCGNCALCTSACRTAALTARNIPRIDLLKQAAAGKRAVFACAPSGRPADAIVPCLGAVDGVMLAYLGKRGVEVELSGTGHCARCEHGRTGADIIARQVEVRDALEAARDGKAWARLSVTDEEEPAEADGFRSGRRGLFRRLIGRGVAEAEKAIAVPMEVPIIDKAIRPGPWHVPEMRELLGIVCRRNSETSSWVPELPFLAAADLRLARGCTACESCVRACPTGALQIRETQGEWYFMLFVDRCVGCRLCIEVCQPKVLHSSETMDLTPAQATKALDIRAKQRCARCDRFFVSTEPQEICPVCGDDDNAFGQIFG